MGFDSGGASSESSYPDAAEAAPNLVFFTDGQGRIVRVNSRLRDYAGFDAADLAAAGETSLGIVHPDDLAASYEGWKHALATGKPFELSHRLRSAKDGRYRWFLERALPNRDASGTIVGWVGVATDIDDRVRAAERSRFLSEAAIALSSSLERQQIIDDFARAAVARFCDGCIVSLLAPNGGLERAGITHRDPGQAKRALPTTALIPARATSPVARVLATKEALLIPDLADESRAGARNADGVTISPVFDPQCSLIVVPLLVANRVNGTIGFVSSEPGHHFDEADLEVAEVAARHAAAALENARAFERERETTERFRFLAEATTELFAASTARVNLASMLRSVVASRADWAVLYVLESDGSVRADAVAYKKPAFSAVEELRNERVFLATGERLFREMVGRHRPVVSSGGGHDPIHLLTQPYLIRAMTTLRPRSLLMVPLYTPDVDFGALTLYLSDHDYSDADVELFEELGRRISLSLEHTQSVARETRLVQTLQELILPSQLPKIPGAVLSTVYAPATTSDAPVGGDWYDAFELADGRFVLSIGDVAGRGLRSSAIMGKLRHAINVIAMYESEPARILDVAERVVLQRYPHALVTAFVALLDPRERRIRYANAGHPYPLLRLWDGSVEPLVADGLPIGLRFMTDPAQSHSRTLEDAALLAFYTDGVTEATRDIEHGEAQLRDALAREGALYVRAPAAMVAASCLTGTPHSDDAALLVLGFPRAIGWSFDAENAKAAWDARGAFIEQLRSETTSESDIGAAEIIFGELIGNVVRHAPGPIDIALEWTDDRGILHVIDRGAGFDFKPPERVDDLREGGRGIWLIEQFGTDLAIERLPHFGAHMRVELPVRRRHATGAPQPQPAG
jgi:PAS domain S-box-containing protein